MHAHEVEIDTHLVSCLLRTQFPEWAHLPLERVEPAGTVNAIYRLGDQMSVRLPLQEEWAWDIEHQAEWLPKLAPYLPLGVPQVLGVGAPAEAYPFKWSIHNWIPGSPWHPERLESHTAATSDLARFISAMRRIDTTGAARPRGLWGVPLAPRDPFIRDAIEKSRDLVDADALTAIWDGVLELSPYEGKPTWVHSDLLFGNVLVDEGRVRAIIDFATAHAGDPARDIRVAWTLLSGSARRRQFREVLTVDDETWARARGWALTMVMALPYYRHTNPAMFESALHTIRELITDLSESTGP
jgi:aminoglycoside phosphotransferase (APT) family kinase protein